MDTQHKNMQTLFEQLGLDGGEASIEAFIADHYPLPDDVKLSEAPFWSPGQPAFLKEEIVEDAEWAPVVDELNVRLHANIPT
ncbi:DUF2789 domain-containing protein [Halopseudomonas sp.]|uniref:DUF2789 domain-containing protein n=1 Tax=Halopseudomonas sp. TaxID=2901191 RepID=UPI0035661778